ncbi:MAG TPA: AmpG family muropeptide MFS transporter [Nitrospirota bacterium]|nr:AmpG family muropeptide MFS transporter [Nitrospirota bacterium]
MTRQPASRNPWTFLPTLYFAEGLPYVLINTVSVILYKRMGIDNAHIAFWTSWLYLPWVIKMFWGPLVDITSTKRTWILSTQLAMGLSLFVVAWSLQTSGFFVLSLAAFVLGAFISATYDIATDGFYMLALSEKDQALFVGLRAAFYRLAMIFGSGFLVYLAGRFETSTGNIPLSWSIVFSIAGALFLIAFGYHRLMLPYPPADGRRTAQDRSSGASFGEVFAAYFRQERVGVVIAFILCYRLGEAMLLKLVPPFLLDKAGSGGLGLSTSDVGLVYGTVGVLSLVTGGILGGWVLSRFGFRRAVWPMVAAMHLPDIFFVYLASSQPSIALVYPLVALEQFGYGMGFTVFTVYLMYSAQGNYKTSHYAISTGIMALGMMVPGLVSGYLQQMVGYRTFFIIVCFLTIPGMLTIPFLPKKGMEKNG